MDRLRAVTHLCLINEQLIKSREMELKALFTHSIQTYEELNKSEKRVKQLSRELKVIRRQLRNDKNCKSFGNNLMTEMIHKRTKISHK